jgi:hypothetical protein
VIRLALILLTLLGQRLLGWPGLHPWASELLLPMVWVVGPAMTEKTWRSALPGLWLGLALDIALGRVVGPGGIAWSAAGLVVRAVGGVLADRSARAWLLLGALGSLLAVLVGALAELPLGILSPFGWAHVARGAALTSAWCGLVGWLRGRDLPARWRRYRARRLR